MQIRDNENYRESKREEIFYLSTTTIPSFLFFTHLPVRIIVLHKYLGEKYTGMLYSINSDSTLFLETFRWKCSKFHIRRSNLLSKQLGR